MSVFTAAIDANEIGRYIMTIKLKKLSQKVLRRVLELSKQGDGD